MADEIKKTKLHFLKLISNIHWKTEVSNKEQTEKHEKFLIRELANTHFEEQKTNIKL